MVTNLKDGFCCTFFLSLPVSVILLLFIRFCGLHWETSNELGLALQVTSAFIQLCAAVVPLCFFLLASVDMILLFIRLG